ncbi:MAG: TolC family protein, partial [Myxococcales bacterium]
MTAKLSSVLTIISGLTVSTFVGAQPAAPAPAAQPKTAVAPVAQSAPAARAAAVAPVAQPAPAARAAVAPVAQPAPAVQQRPGVPVAQPNAAAPRPAIAPNAQPNAAAPQPNVAGTAAQTAGAQPDPMTATVTTRDAPKGHNPVMEAFAPQQNGLTAKMVAKRAVASSHTIEAKNAELRAAAARVDSAMYQFLPRVALKASYSRLSRVKVGLGSGYSLGAATTGPYVVSDGRLGYYMNHDNNNNTPDAFIEVKGGNISFPIIVDNYSLSATLSVPLSDYVLRMSDSIQGTKKNQQASELNIKAERTKVEGDARVAFYNWARAIGQVAITENSIERVRARLKDVEASFTVGMVTKTDLLRL